jgi:hypothetical protein
MEANYPVDKMKLIFSRYIKTWKKIDIKLFAIALSVLLLTLLSVSTSALTINSTNYSGFITSGASSGNLTGDTIDGSTAGFYQQPIRYLNDLLYSGLASFSFNVSAPTGNLPSLTINLPENETYLKNTNLKLNFTSSLASYVWYNLDGTGSNTTITENTTFTAADGLHTLYLWANNTYGNSTKNITFTANETKHIISYDNYSGSTRGESTDFNKSSYEDIQDLSGVILENTNYGKIKFNVVLNLTNDSNLSDNTFNLDIYTSILNNSIFINSTALPNFNKSATLYLYSLALTNPRVLRDGEACSSAICAEVNYSGGTFVFNVTQFSNYSADETPAAGLDTTVSPGGGGGGGTASTAFITDKSQISVTLTPGQVKTENITITNTGSQVASFKIENLLPDFIVRREDIIVLNPGESRAIPLYILARVDTIPDLYLGKIIISSGSTKKEILIAIEVESEGVLLDVRAEILEDYGKILPGGEVLAEMRLFNLGEPGERKDVLIEYIIKDYDDNVIVTETESLAIQTQTTFIKRISIPADARLGNYTLYVKATYEGKIASSSDNFEVVSSTVTDNEKIYIIIIIILSVIISLVVYLSIEHQMRKHYKEGKTHEKTVGKVNLSKIMKK